MRFVIAALACLAAASTLRATEPLVVLVVIDGLGATDATPERLPRLAARAAEPAATWTTARGVLPARTNPNHTSLLTGYWPDGHGIVGNRFWDGEAGVRRPMDDPRLIEAETLFDVMAAERPDLHAAAFFGKSKLGRLFAAAPPSHAGPRTMWTAEADHAPGAATVDAATRLLDDGSDPALLVVGIADVDLAAHGAGPGTAPVVAAIDDADRAVGGLLDALVARGLWGRAVVIVTSDHGFAPASAESVVRLPAGDGGEVAWVDEGRVALGHGATPDATARAAAAMRARSGVASVRTDLEAFGLGHPRAGSLLVFARPGTVFAIDGAGYAMRGDHGGEEERDVPFVVLGGHPSLRRLPTERRPDLPDVGPTVAAILGMRPPRTRVHGDVRRGVRLPLMAPAPGPARDASGRRQGSGEQAMPPQCSKKRSKITRASSVMASTRASAAAANASGSPPAVTT